MLRYLLYGEKGSEGKLTPRTSSNNHRRCQSALCKGREAPDIGTGLKQSVSPSPGQLQTSVMRRCNQSNLDASRQKIIFDQSFAAGTLGNSDYEGTNTFDDKSLLDLSYTLFEQNEDENDDVPVDFEFA